MQAPQTRPSLIGRLADPACEAAYQAAWSDFIHDYRPAIYRVARGRGLQHADADDVTQDVLATVARRLETFHPARRGSFRGWLLKITRDAVVNRLTRRPRDVAIGDSAAAAALANYPGAEPTETLLGIEHRRVMLAAAAERVRPQLSDSTWQSFWQTAVVGRSIAEVASVLNKSQGSVRVARCRVLARLRLEVQKDDCPFSL